MRIHLLCIHERISCLYTRDLLCMHNTLVHALGKGPQGPGTQRGSGPGPGTGPAEKVFDPEIQIQTKERFKI